MLDAYLRDEAATSRLASVLAQRLQAHTREGVAWQFHLNGNLGGGKTTFVRLLLRELGITAAVRSPTYTLIEPYELPDKTQVHHLDLYRMADPEELEYLGLAEMCEQAGLMFVEWPEMGGDFLPPADFVLHFDYREEGRQLLIKAVSQRAQDSAIIAGLNSTQWSDV